MARSMLVEEGPWTALRPLKEIAHSDSVLTACPAEEAVAGLRRELVEAEIAATHDNAEGEEGEQPRDPQRGEPEYELLSC